MTQGPFQNRSTAPSIYHQWVVRQIFLALYAQLDSAGFGLSIWSPLGVFMPGCEPVQPDLVVIRREDYGIIRDRRIEGIPALLVEVLSPGNAVTDTEIKRRAYARAGVPEYWIARPAQQDVLVYTQPDAALGDYLHSQPFGSAAELVSPTLPIRASVAGFFAEAPDTTL